MPHNKTNPNTNTLILVSLIPNHTHEMCAAVSHLKNLATTRKTHMRRQKTVTSQVLTSTHPGDKTNTLFSLERR